MIEDAMTAQAHDIIDARRREADVYRAMIDAAPLRFRKRNTLTETRRSIASALNRLADAIAP
jgi:hypothetical protein